MASGTALGWHGFFSFFAHFVFATPAPYQRRARGTEAKYLSRAIALRRALCQGACEARGLRRIDPICDVCGAGAVVTFPRIGPVDAERKEPQFARSMMSSCGESPRGILKSLKKKVSEALEPAALDSLPRLVGALPGSYYLHDIIDEIDEAHYQRELKQFKKYSPDKDPDPEEEEYWRHETKHSIS